MNRYDAERRRVALTLAFLAGQVDATGFVVAGGYFTSFMSGNTTRLGVDVSTGLTLGLVPLMIIGAFVSGVITGALIARRWPVSRQTVLLTLTTAFIVGAALALGSGLHLVFLCAAAFAMGSANNVFSNSNGVTVGVTYMTGALVRFGQGLAARLAGGDAGPMRGYGALWCALAIGAFCGAAVAHESTQWAAISIAAVSVLVCVHALLTGVDHDQST